MELESDRFLQDARSTMNAIEDLRVARFCIISSARSGSNMLQSLLDNHPEIRCYGEIFNPSFPLGYIKWSSKTFLRRLLARFCRDYSVQTYLDSLVTNAPRGKTAIGFKVMYPGQFNRCALFPYYWQEHGFKLVRLIRENLLRRFVSGQIASQENTWSSQQRRERASTIRLDPNELERALIRMTLVNRNIDTLIAQFESITVTYDELLETPENTISGVCTFLDVGKEGIDSLSPRTVRQNPFPLEELIENYEEVCKKFANTEYEWMLK